MGYWQQNNNKRKWYDPVSGTWKRDHSVWVPTSDAVTNPPQDPPNDPPEQLRTLQTLWQYNQYQTGYINRTTCTPVNLVPMAYDQPIPTNADFYNAIYPLYPGYPDTELNDVQYWGPPKWRLIEVGGIPPKEIPLQPSWELARFYAESPQYVSWFENPNQPVPLGHRDSLGQVGPMDPQYLGTNTLTSPGPVLLVNWEKMSLTPNDIRKIQIEMTSTFDKPGEQKQTYTALWPICFNAGSNEIGPPPSVYDSFQFISEGSVDTDPATFNYDALAPSTFGDIEVTEVNVDPIIDKFNLPFGANELTHDWGYEGIRGFQVDLHVVVRETFSASGSIPVEIFRTEDEQPNSNPPADVYTILSDVTEIRYTHTFDLTNAAGKRAQLVVQVVYCPTANPPPVVIPIPIDAGPGTFDFVQYLKDNNPGDEADIDASVFEDQPPNGTGIVAFTGTTPGVADIEYLFLQSQVGDTEAIGILVTGPFGPKNYIVNFIIQEPPPDPPEFQTITSTKFFSDTTFTQGSVQLMTDTANEATHDTWDQFLNTVLELKPASANNYIDVYIPCYIRADTAFNAALTIRTMSDMTGAANIGVTWRKLDGSETSVHSKAWGFNAGTGFWQMSVTRENNMRGVGATLDEWGFLKYRIFPVGTQQCVLENATVVGKPDSSTLLSCADAFVADLTGGRTPAELFGSQPAQLGPGGWETTVTNTSVCEFQIPKADTLGDMIFLEFQGGVRVYPNGPASGHQNLIGTTTGAARMSSDRIPLSFALPTSDATWWRFAIGIQPGANARIAGFRYYKPT